MDAITPFNALQVWTDERIAALRDMWDAGRPASEIAAAIGVTRNAVIGKAHRLDLASRKRSPHSPQTKHVRKAAQKVRKETRLSPAPKLVPALPVDDQAIPLEQRRNILSVKPGECHYPVGDPGEPGFFICGAPAGTRIYCVVHFNRCFKPGG